MRAKRNQLIITFPSTISAMEWETAAKQGCAPGRLIPVPTVITASCGLAWKAEPEDRAALAELARKNELPYEQMVELIL